MKVGDKAIYTTPYSKIEYRCTIISVSVKHPTVRIEYAPLANGDSYTWVHISNISLIDDTELNDVLF